MALRQEVPKGVCHEFHHVRRWDGPGSGETLGETLGEALLSEGGQAFVHEMMDCPQEPWALMPPGFDLGVLCPRAEAAFEATDHDHAARFFGGGDLQHGVGHALGRMRVERIRATRPGQTAPGMAGEPAAGFRGGRCGGCCGRMGARPAGAG